MGISIWQLLIVLLIVVVLFGTKRLRSLGGDLGSAIKNFRGAMKEGEEEPQREKTVDQNGRVIDGEAHPESKTSDHKTQV